MKNKSGFTLIELVVVVAVLGILAGFALMRIQGSIAAAKGARIVADLRSLDSAIAIMQARDNEVITHLDHLVPKELAALPIPPTGDFSVTTNLGVQKDYRATEYSADAYTYDIASGRAFFAGHPVEYYLAGDATNLSLSLNKIIATFKEYKSFGKLDSFSQGSGTTEALAALKAQGIDLAALGAVSWSYYNIGSTTGTDRFLFSAVDISGLAVGTIVPMIQYNPNNGNYSVWYGKVTANSDSSVNNGVAYNILRNSTGYKPSTGSSENNNQSYASALNYYQIVAAELGYK